MSPSVLLTMNGPRSYHLLERFGRSAQVLYELQGEEVEGVRQEVREENDEENGEARENRTHHERMWMTLK